MSGSRPRQWWNQSMNTTHLRGDNPDKWWQQIEEVSWLKLLQTIPNEVWSLTSEEQLLTCQLRGDIVQLFLLKREDIPPQYTLFSSCLQTRVVGYR